MASASAFTDPSLCISTPDAHPRGQGTVVKHLAFIADDFGLDAAVNEAILEGHHHGALTGASLMMGQPGTDDAVAAAGSFPGLEIGWHLHLCDSRPLTLKTWPWGNSPVRAGFSLALTPGCRRRIRSEIEAQWNAFRQTGLPCRFINTHHHLHLHPWVFRILMETVGSVPDAWFRGGSFRTFGTDENLTAALTRRIGALRASAGSTAGFLPTPATVWGLDRVCGMSAREINAVASSLPAGLHEFMFHPRSVNSDADLAALWELVSRRAAAEPIRPKVRGIPSE